MLYLGLLVNCVAQKEKHLCCGFRGFAFGIEEMEETSFSFITERAYNGVQKPVTCILKVNTIIMDLRVVTMECFWFDYTKSRLLDKD